MTKNLVSIIVAVYNGEKFISEAIESLLGQTYRDFEIIAVDDGSMDKTADIIKSFSSNKIKLINQNNQGASVARNKAISIASGEYIAIADADDISYPHRLEKQMEYLITHNECVALGGNAEIIDEEGNYVFCSNIEINPLKIQDNMFNGSAPKKIMYMPFYHSSVMFKKDVFLKSGTYPVILNRAEDVVLFYKMAKFGELHNLPQKIIKYRIVPSATTLRDKKDSDLLMKILLKVINNEAPSGEDLNYLEKTSNKDNTRQRKYYYHLFLGKKYLWNNYQPKLVRKHILKALGLNPFKLYSYIIYILSLFPSSLISKIYNKVKE